MEYKGELKSKDEYEKNIGLDIDIKEMKNKDKNPSVDLGHGRKRVETQRPEGVSEKKESPGLGKKQDIK